MLKKRRLRAAFFYRDFDVTAGLGDRMSELDNVKIELIDYQGVKTSCWAPVGKNLWEILTVNGMNVGAYCGGKHNCGKCKVRIEGQVSPMEETERGQLLPEEIKAGIRLACCQSVNEPLTIYMDYLEPAAKPKLDVNRLPRKKEKGLPVKLRQFFIPGIDREQPYPVMSRLAEALPECLFELSLDNMNQLAALDRIGRPAMELYALIFNDRIVKYIGRQPHKALGVALDLGTTSLCAALVDLTDGDTIALESKTNMQRIYGADIISRVSYCIENTDGISKLRQVLVNNINSMIDEMLKRVQANIDDIYSFAVAGNPVMLHLFTGVNISGFAIAPYVGVFKDELSLPASQLELMAAPEAQVIVLPQIGGFVGADTVAGLLALGHPQLNSYLFIDIGTNAEIVLFHRGDMWAASAAAGPAFEGGGITCGMRAVSGAIDRVILQENGELTFNVLGNLPAKGICGSGIIDLVACLLQAGYIDSNGTISELGYERLKTRQNQLWPDIILADDEPVPVIFSQEDIRQVQLAKSAIRSAIDILCREARLKTAQIEGIFIAGAFASYMVPESAISIGLLPTINKELIINCGNAAAEGAIEVLLSEEKRKQARLLSKKIRYVELAMQADFQEVFINNLNF